METERTIRNCLPTFRFQCPKRWEDLSPGETPTVRFCGVCSRQVFFCETDEETIAHAQAGDCIARAMPIDTGPRRVVIGRPSGLPPTPPVTPQQAELGRLMSRERGIDDAIKNAGISSRICPQCGYPAPGWRITCRVCGFEMDRATDQH